jgi:hypothetical protein
MNDALVLATFVAGAISLAILLAAFLMFVVGSFPDSHFGRGLAATGGTGAILVWLVREMDSNGLGVALLLWFGAIILVGAYGAVLDSFAWLRGDYDA